MKNLVKICMMVCVMLVICSISAQAAEPKVMIQEYKVSGDGKMHSGKEFDLSITLYNTSKRTVRNMKVTVLSETGEVLPVNSAGTAYIEQLDAETEETIKVKMKLDGVLQEKTYKLGVKLAYEDINGYAYNVDDAVFLSPATELEYYVSDVSFEGDNMVGEPFTYSGKVNNSGNGTLYNVKIKVEGENVNPMMTGIGNIEPGKSQKFTLDTSYSHATAGTNMMNSITVTYEDREGNEYVDEDKKTLSDLFGALGIENPDYRNLEIVKDEEPNNTGKIIGISVAVAFILLVFVGSIIRKQKRKKEILEAFE